VAVVPVTARQCWLLGFGRARGASAPRSNEAQRAAQRSAAQRSAVERDGWARLAWLIGRRSRSTGLVDRRAGDRSDNFADPHGRSFTSVFYLRLSFSLFPSQFALSISLPCVVLEQCRGECVRSSATLRLPPNLLL